MKYFQFGNGKQGKQFKYRCVTTGCWKSKKPACGYKEMSLHEAAEHGLFEKMAEEDERPEIRQLMKDIRTFQAKV